MKSSDRNPLACDKSWSEHQASLAMARTIKQNRQDDVRAANRESDKKEADRKQSVNQQFWHSMKEIIFIIVCAAIAVYTLIHFA